METRFVGEDDVIRKDDRERFATDGIARETSGLDG